MMIGRAPSPGLLTVRNALTALRLLPVSDRDKNVEILALRHQITILERQLGADTRVRFAPEDGAFLAALPTSLPREAARAPRPGGHHHLRHPQTATASRRQPDMRRKPLACISAGQRLSYAGWDKRALQDSNLRPSD